ncbi:MAG: nuclear transport factor 2 family protein [Flavobacteriaceae bacterium]
MARPNTISNLSFPFLLLIVAMVMGSYGPKNTVFQGKNLEPETLYETIKNRDSVFFSAYNRCDLVTQAAMLSDSVEFYHDQGGLSTSKQDILEKTKENICGKVSRELVEGSLEVYPIKGYGAVEIGMHKFRNNQEAEETPSHASKFIIIWQQNNNDWQMARVISLH